MLTPKLFAKLPDYISTPDGMEIDRHGNLVLSCPNFADADMPGVVVKLDKDGNTTKWFDVPVGAETGISRNMGICFDKNWDLYICDNPGWTGKPEYIRKGRLLRVRVDDAGNIEKCTVIAEGMEHPNGVKIWGDYVYVTQSTMELVNDPSGKLVSVVYRFHVDDENIKITNTMQDPNILAKFITRNPDCQYGTDGLDFDKNGNLYVGNFGDGEIWKLTFFPDGVLKDQTLFAGDKEQLISTDGFCFDDAGNMYIADFSMNAICKMYPDGRLERIAQSPDCDLAMKLAGGLDQPGEPRVYNGKIIASCFDLVTDEGKVNRQHLMPATLAMLEL